MGKEPELQGQFLSRLLDALRSSTPATYVEKPFRGVDNIVQFRAGDVMRGYCVFTDELPSYNLFYFLQVTDHDYDAYPVAKYDGRVETVVDELGELSDESEVEAYLHSRSALDAGEVEELVDSI